MTHEELEGHEVRLFPSVHISSTREAELRAASSLLAMVRAVSEFGRIVVRAAGGPGGRIACYAEVSFKRGDPPLKTVRPDGIIRVVRGNTQWSALVEVKVGDSPLDPEQVEIYHKLAGEEGVDAFVMISNQAALPNGRPPVALDGRRLRRVPVVHLSWERLLAEARLLSNQKEVEDPDQHWMLDEWIKYVAAEESRIIDPPSLGVYWSVVLQAAKEQKLSAVSSQLTDVTEHWDAFLKKLALRLRAKMGADVQRRTSRADVKNPDGRIKRMYTEALHTGILTGALQVRGAIGELGLELMLQGKVVRFSVSFPAPREGRTKTRLTWLLRQLDTDDLLHGLRVRVDWNKRGLYSEALVDALQDGHMPLMVSSDRVAIPGDVQPRVFILSWTKGLATKRGRTGVHVLAGIADGVERFYRQVMEGLVPYVPKAPRLPYDEAKESSPEKEAPSAPSRALPPRPDESASAVESAGEGHDARPVGVPPSDELGN